MGYTKRQLVDAALEEIGLDPVEFDVNGAEYQRCLRRLDAMIANWDGKGLPLGYFLVSNPDEINIDAESGLADWANEAVYLNLAILIAPSFGKQIFPDTKKQARMAKTALYNQTAFRIEMQYPNTFPVGAGNKSWNWKYNRFFYEQEILSEVEEP